MEQQFGLDVLLQFRKRITVVPGGLSATTFGRICILTVGFSGYRPLRPAHITRSIAENGFCRKHNSQQSSSSFREASCPDSTY